MAVEQGCLILLVIIRGMNRGTADSLKESKSQASVAFYLFVGVITCFCIALIVVTFIFIQKNTPLIQASFPSVALNTVLYICAGLVFITILVMLFNSQYEFYLQPKNTGINRYMPPYTTFWQPSKLENPTDPVYTKIESADFPMSQADVYSMGIDILISDTRASENGPYRHILHRGSDELKNFTPNSPGSIPKGQGDLNDGLPLQMNPGVFIDQYTNDLVIFIDTDPPNGGGQAYRESIRISDIPVKNHFVFICQFMTKY